jgi:hypothetical protein
MIEVNTDYEVLRIYFKIYFKAKFKKIFKVYVLRTWIMVSNLNSNLNLTF